jgi:hypothetical protein
MKKLLLIISILFVLSCGAKQEKKQQIKTDYQAGLYEHKNKAVLLLIITVSAIGMLMAFSLRDGKES